MQERKVDQDKIVAPAKNLFDVVVYDGKELTVKEWAEQLGLVKSEVMRKLREGVSAEEILFGIKSENVDNSVDKCVDNFSENVDKFTEKVENVDNFQNNVDKCVDNLKLPVRSNTLVMFNGECRTIKEWSEITGIHISTLRGRVKRGWSPEAVLSVDGLNYVQNKKGKGLQSRSVRTSIDYWFELRLRLKDCLDARKLPGDHMKNFNLGLDSAYFVLDLFMVDNYKLDNKTYWWDLHAASIENLIDERKFSESQGFNIGLKTAWNMINEFMSENFN